MIVRTTTERPEVLALGLADGQVVDARKAAPHEPVRARLASFGHHGRRSRSRHRGHAVVTPRVEDLRRRAIIASMSRIAILGASGGLGTHLITSALEHGFEVSALVRDPEKITRANYNLTLIKGDAGSGEDVQAAIEECRFVVSALGARKPVMTACVQNLVRELQAVKVLKRFICVSWLGAGDSAMQAQGVSELRSAITRTTHKKMFDDISRAEGIIRASRLPYVILRPTRLTDGAPTHSTVAVDAKEAPPGPISRVDLAHFVFRILEEPGWERREVTVGSK